MSNQQMNTHQQGNQQLTPVKKLLLPQIKALCRDEKEALSVYATAVRLASNPKIMECSPESIVIAFTQAIDLGLRLDPVYGECDFLPYSGKLGLQLRAKGYALLAEREGGWEIQTIPVFNCDIYEVEQVFENGWLSEKVTFKPNVSERELHAQDEDWVFKNLRLVIANARRNVASGKVETASVSMTKAMIEHRRSFSQAQRVGKYTKPEEKARLSAGLPIGIWQEHYTAMAIKTVLGTIGKKLPKTSKMEHALKFLNVESEADQSIADTTLPSIDADSYIVDDTIKNEVAELAAIPENTINWGVDIEECGSKETLLQLLDDMPDDARIEYGYLIDSKLDSFPDEDQQGDKSLEIDPYADLRLVIEESESLSEITNLLKEMKQHAKVALAGVIRKRQDEIKALQAA